MHASDTSQSEGSAFRTAPTLIIREQQSQSGSIEELSLWTDITLRKQIAITLLTIFSIANLAILTLVFILALKIPPSEKVILTLIGATVVETATMTVTITNYLFPKPGR